MKKYVKLPLTYHEQIELLFSRGLMIDDKEKAERFLTYTNYYRFSAYCIPFEKYRHKFKSNVCFSQIQKLYDFDRLLRFLIDEALEVIEIALRSKIAYYLAHKYGVFAHEDASNFYRKFNHREWIAKVHRETQRVQEQFIAHYKRTYKGFPKIPIWMAVEIMSFGSLSILFANLLRNDQVTIAKDFGVHSSVLRSWLHTFVYVRNVCAHHARLWNREFAISIKMPKKDKKWQGVNTKRVIAVIFAINKFFAVLNSKSHIVKLWRKDMEDLFSQKIHVDGFYTRMGINVDLVNHPLWKETV